MSFPIFSSSWETLGEHTHQTPRKERRLTLKELQTAVFSNHSSVSSASRLLLIRKTTDEITDFRQAVVESPNNFLWILCTRFQISVSPYLPHN